MKKVKTSIIWVSPEVSSYKYNQALEISKKLKKDSNVPSICFHYLIYLREKSYKVYKKDKKYIFFSNVSYLVNLIEKSESTYIVIDGYRFVDLTIARFLNMINLKKKFKIIYIQHGRYTKLNRKLKLSKHYIIKTTTYLSFFINSFISFPTLNLRKLFTKTTIDYGFLFSPSDYWKKFHNNHGYFFKNYKEIRDKDSDKFTFSNIKHRKKKILYIAQTLVEDTRCSKFDQKHFALSFQNLCNKVNLEIDIRPHPRSNVSLLKECFPNSNFLQIENSEFYLYDCVITHNSSLSIVFLNMNIPVLFYDLNNERLPIGLENHKNSFKILNLKELETYLSNFTSKNNSLIKQVKRNKSKNPPSIYSSFKNIFY